MNDEQHIPIKNEPFEVPEKAAESARGGDPVYTDLPGGEGVRSGEEGAMPTVTQTVEYGRTSATTSHPAPPPVPDVPQPPMAGAPTSESGTPPFEGGRPSSESGAPHADSSQAAQEAYDGEWEEVVASLTVLGDSIGRWARAAVRDPNYRRHAEELKGALRGVAGKVGEAVDDATQSEVAQGFKEAAVKTGGTIYETGQRVYRDAVAPGLAEAFRGAAEGLRFAAQKLEESRERAQEAAARAEAQAQSAPEGEAVAAAPTTAGSDTEPGVQPPDPTEI